MTKPITAVLSATAAALLSTSALADTAWPQRTVQVVVPASPGGDTDFNARTMAKYFEQIAGRSMVITNMPGGGGSIATSHVRDANTDGYTMLFAHTGQMIVNEVAGLIDYGIDDFAICCIPGVDKGAVFVASRQSGLETTDQLVERTKQQPGSVIFGTELGGYSHLQGLIFQNLSGAEMRVVDTGSAAEKVANLLGGRIHVGGISYGAVQDYVTSGAMVVLGQPNAERNALLGDIPTFAEQGIGFVMDKPYIIAFPQGTDPAIVTRMSDIMREITEIAAYAEDLEQGFRQPVTFYPEDEAVEHLRAIRDDYMQYRQMLQESR